MRVPPKALDPEHDTAGIQSSRESHQPLMPAYANMIICRLQQGHAAGHLGCWALAAYWFVTLSSSDCRITALLSLQDIC